MVSPRDWIPGVGGNDQTIIEEKSVEEWDLEARNVETELSILESELDQLDNEFREQIQMAAEAPETQRPRHKRKAKQKQKEKEQKEARYNEMLDEYGTLLTLKNAKERLQTENKSSLHDMSHEEIEEVKRTIKGDLNERNQSHEKIQKLDQTVDQTLTALTDSQSAGNQDELDELIDAVAEGETDISEVDANIESETNTSSEAMETESSY